MNMATLQKDIKLWNATVVVITKGRTEEEAKSNIKKGVHVADDILEIEEETMHHIENEKHRERLVKDIFRELRRRE